MTPVSWSPNRNDEKHESLGTEESKNSEDTGLGEEIWSETEEESENSEETGSAETDWWSETEEESGNSEETGSAETYWWSETEEESGNSEETGSAETYWWSETKEESENSEETSSAETDWWSETEEESENSEEKDTKKNWWSSWNHGKEQEKQHIKSDWYQNDMESSETRDSSDSQEEADMGEFAKLAKGLFGLAGAFGGLNAEVESMEVNMSGLRMETGFAASGNGGQSNITEKMNVNQMAVAPPRNNEGGIVSSLNFAIDKIEMKLNGLKIGMGGGEGMQGATPSNIHEVMMKSHFRHMGSENGEDYY